MEAPIDEARDGKMSPLYQRRAKSINGSLNRYTDTSRFPPRWITFSHMHRAWVLGRSDFIWEKRSLVERGNALRKCCEHSQKAFFELRGCRKGMGKESKKRKKYMVKSYKWKD